jgi:predicted RNase H-like nuclease (RuvC/YqgF family)
MRRPIVGVMALIGVLLLGATIVSYSKYRKSAADYSQAKTDEESMRQRYDGAVNEIVMIQDSLNTIMMGGETVLPDAREAEGPGTMHDKVLSRIATLRASVERTKGRIEELDARLKRGGVKIAGLERMIGKLRRSVSDREQQIAMLNNKVESLNTQVAGLATEVVERQQDLNAKRLELEIKQEALTDKQRELATIFYTMGTKKELKRSGVVVAEGGVVGVGKTLKPSGTFNMAAFTPMNTDQETVIPIPAHSVKVLSPQSVASYTLYVTGKDTMELRITNPSEFRKVKHLIILKA